MAMTRFKNIPASAASTLVEGYCSDFIQLSASLAQTLEQVSMRNLPLGASRGSLQRVEQGMRELSDAIAILLRATAERGGAPGDLPPRPITGAPVPGPGPAAKRPAAVTSDDCTIQGTSDSMPLMTVFQILSRMRKTGILHVAIGEERLSFQLANGCLDATGTNRPPTAERIGALLVEQGVVRRDLVEAQALEQTESSGYLGMQMVNARLITHRQLMEGLEKQAKIRIRRAVKAKQATYELHEGPRQPSDGLIRLGLELQAPPRKR